MLTLAPFFFSPREPHTTLLFSPWAQVLEVGEPSHARNSVRQGLEERVSPGGRFPSLSSLALQNLPPPHGGGASAMGDPTSLPGRPPPSLEAQVCEGSDGEAEAEAAAASAAKSR